MPRREMLRVPPEGSAFQGIDRRNIQVGSDPSTVYDAVDVDLTPGGSLRRRDGSQVVADLPPGTFGLYALGGSLRVAAPAGQGLASGAPPGIAFDVFGTSASASTDPAEYARVSSVSNWGAVAGRGAQPYLSFLRADGEYEHHWINDTPARLDGAINTRVRLPFRPGPDVVKLQGKLLAVDRDTGIVRFCSTVQGPSAWDERDAPADAGFISPLEHALSDPSPKGLTTYQGRLLVVYEQAMQVWEMDPDPANHVFVAAYNGPGTQLFGSLSSVVGDVFYFSEGGFRSMATQTVTGELRQGDVGAPIEDLTRAFHDVDPSRVRSLWSQARSQYLCAFNSDTADESTVFAFTRVADTRIQGWTRWELPYAVDYMAELDGALYVRSGDTVYRLREGYATDDAPDGSASEVDGVVSTHFIGDGIARRPRDWQTVDIVQQGSCGIDVLPDQRDRGVSLPVARGLQGSTHDLGAIPLEVFAHAIALRLESSDPAWRLTGIDLDMMVLDGLG